jgi:hypothetical protein
MARNIEGQFFRSRTYQHLGDFRPAGTFYVKPVFVFWGDEDAVFDNPGRTGEPYGQAPDLVDPIGPREALTSQAYWGAGLSQPEKDSARAARPVTMAVLRVFIVFSLHDMPLPALKGGSPFRLSRNRQV